MFKLYLRHKGQVRVLDDPSLENALDNGRMWLATGGDGFHVTAGTDLIASSDPIGSILEAITGRSPSPCPAS